MNVPLVFAAGCHNHKLKLFDLRAAKNISKATTLAQELKASEKLIPFPLTSVSFSAKSPGLICTGDAFGRVHIWKLTPSYFSKNPDENKILATIGLHNEWIIHVMIVKTYYLINITVFWENPNSFDSLLIHTVFPRKLFFKFRNEENSKKYVLSS